MPTKPPRTSNRVERPRVKLTFKLVDDQHEGPQFTVRVDGYKLLQGYGLHRLSSRGANGTEALNRISSRLLGDPMVYGAKASSNLLVLSVTVLATHNRLRELVLRAFGEAGLEVTNTVPQP